MDLLQEQIANLNAKIDALRNQIDQLSSRMSDSLSDSSLAGDKGLRSSLRSQAGRYSQQHRYSLDADMEHKDILSDADFLDTDSHSGEHSLSPELQIQRLTAQLTAAYNRIAALEEQLLSKRIAH